MRNVIVMAALAAVWLLTQFNTATTTTTTTIYGRWLQRKLQIARFDIFAHEAASRDLK